MAEEREPFREERQCAYCGIVYVAKVAHQRYCTPDCRDKQRQRYIPGRQVDRPSATQRGYGADHQRERKKWQPLVEAGRAQCSEIVCLYPTRALDPREPWHLAHDHRTGEYLGPAHTKCNTAEAGRRSGDWSRARRLRTKVCEACGFTFDTVYPRQRFCNPACRQRGGLTA